MSRLDVVASESCLGCGLPFEILRWESDFLGRHSLPLPAECPECRCRQRMAQINIINLFKRQCDATGKSIISNYPPESPHKIFEQGYWYSDEHDGKRYGRDFDFSRPFFEQYHELLLEVPRSSLVTGYLDDINSAYTNYAAFDKNCYFLFTSGGSEDSMYCFGLNESKDAVDCFQCYNMELCYESLDCVNCYQTAFAKNCENCTDCYLVESCIGCSNCIMCCNLVRKEYHILNKPVSKEEFEKVRAELTSRSRLKELLAQFDDFVQQFPVKSMHGSFNEDVTGDYVVSSTNAYNVFDSGYIEDGLYCNRAFLKCKDFLDCEGCGDAEIVSYSVNSGMTSYNLKFCVQCHSDVSNLTYCDMCVSGCTDLFGCIGLKRSKHCILNKQFSKDDYTKQVDKIVAHMKETGEWGRFFPLAIATVPYNLSLAQLYYPKSKEEVISGSLVWHDKVSSLPAQVAQPPDDISQVSDGLCSHTLQCQGCGSGYRLQQKELSFYRRFGVPAPDHCFFCRNLRRLNSRAKRCLYDRECDLCSVGLRSVFPSDFARKVLCGRCFAEELI